MVLEPRFFSIPFFEDVHNGITTSASPEDAERRSKSLSDARFAVINSASAEHLRDILEPDIFEELLSRALPEATHFGSMLLSGLGDSNAKVLAAANSPSREVLMEKLNDMDDWTESRVLGCRFASELPILITSSRVLRGRSHCRSWPLFLAHASLWSFSGVRHREATRG